MAEDETSLQKRPELNLKQLKQGGLIVGADQNAKGSLMALTGMALERITRERAEVPPDQRLPENVVYLMDPDAKRLIMISRRDASPEWKSGLFAETVELDDEGKPRFRLSTKEVTLPKNQYQMVAVGPNPYNMPPSHIPMVEEETPGQEKFVPWNIYLANLQSWMNKVTLDPNEDFETFMKRFHELRNKSRIAAEAKVKTAFVGGSQGFDETVAPFNLIISDDTNKEMYMRASLDAGLFPVFISAKDFVLRSRERPERNEELEKLRRRRSIYGDWRSFIGHFLPGDWSTAAKSYSPAVITQDFTSVWRLEDQDREFVEEVISPAGIHVITIDDILKNNPIFTYVYLMRDVEGDPRKEGNGSYQCPNTEQTYREFLYKIKSDLLLTMFLRGGAPLIK